jgi:hypothetical protein
MNQRKIEYVKISAIKAKMEFKEMMENSIAPLTLKVVNPETSRKKMIAKFNKRISDLHRAQDVLEVLPMGAMLYIRASVRIRLRVLPGHVSRDTDLVVTGSTLNADSVQCILWSMEYESWLTDRMKSDMLESKIAIKFTEIKSWRLWTPEDAALTVNHLYQTVPYKKLAYGTE